MSNQFKTIGLIGKYGDPHIADTLATMANFLTARQLEVMLDDETARTVPGLGLPTGDREEIGRRCDLALVIGGAGTLLNAVRSLADFGIPVCGINLGRRCDLALVIGGDGTRRGAGRGRAGGGGPGGGGGRGRRGGRAGSAPT